MTYGIGIVGAGMIAPFHLEAIEGLPNARAVGIMDHGSGKGRAIAPDLDPTGADDIEAFLARDDVDIITIVLYFGQVALDNCFAADSVGALDFDHLVEPSRAEQGRVENIRPVGRPHKEYVPVTFGRWLAKQSMYPCLEFIPTALLSNTVHLIE